MPRAAPSYSRARRALSGQRLGKRIVTELLQMGHYLLDPKAANIQIPQRQARSSVG